MVLEDSDRSDTVSHTTRSYEFCLCSAKAACTFVADWTAKSRFNRPSTKPRTACVASTMRSLGIKELDAPALTSHTMDRWLLSRSPKKSPQTLLRSYGHDPRTRHASLTPANSELTKPRHLTRANA